MRVFLRAYLGACLAVVALCLAGILGALGHDTTTIVTSAICLPINAAWTGLAIALIRMDNRDRALEAAADTAEQATQGHGQPKDTR